MTLVVDLRPPELAGPLRIGADRAELIAALREFGVPRLVTRTPGASPSWAVDRPSGLAIRCHLDRAAHLYAIEFGRPGCDSDVVRYRDIDVFGTPADDVIAALYRQTRVVEEEHGYACVAPDLLLSCWRATIPKDAEDTDGRYFDSVLLARPGFYTPNRADA